MMKKNTIIGGIRSAIRNISRKQLERRTPLTGTQSAFLGQLPDIPLMKNITSPYLVWKNLPMARGSSRAKINSALSNGYTLKTMKAGDVDAASKRVQIVQKDIDNPHNRFYLSLRSAFLNLFVYDLAVFETGKRPKKGFMFPLDSRFVKLIPNASGTAVDKVEYDPENNGKSVTLNRGEFAYVSLDTFGSGLRGVPLFESIMNPANLYDKLETSHQKQLQNNGTPAHLFTLESADWNDWIRTAKILRKSKPGSNILLKGKITATSLGNNLRDMEFSNLHDKITEDVMTVTQTPAIMMAQKGGSQGETNRQEMNSFAGEILAGQKAIMSLVAQSIVNIYGTNFADIFLDINPWVDSRQQAAIDRSDITAGIISVNEARRKRGLGDVEWGEFPWNTNLIGQLIGKIPWVTEVPEEKPEDDEEDSEEEEEPTEEAEPNPDVNEGNDGSEQPAGQDRDQIKSDIEEQDEDLYGKDDCERQEDETVDECIARKISIIKREDPDISDDQAFVIAEALCDC